MHHDPPLSPLLTSDDLYDDNDVNDDGSDSTSSQLLPTTPDKGKPKRKRPDRESLDSIYLCPLIYPPPLPTSVTVPTRFPALLSIHLKKTSSWYKPYKPMSRYFIIKPVKVEQNRHSFHII